MNSICMDDNFNVKTLGVNHQRLYPTCAGIFSDTCSPVSIHFTYHIVEMGLIWVKTDVVLFKT